MNKIQHVLTGTHLTGTCMTCGRRGVTGTAVHDGSTQSITVRGSAHSHQFRSDDGDGRGNGAVRIENAVIAEVTR